MPYHYRASNDLRPATWFTTVHVRSFMVSGKSCRSSTNFVWWISGEPGSWDYTKMPSKKNTSSRFINWAYPIFWRS